MKSLAIVSLVAILFILLVAPVRATAYAVTIKLYLSGKTEPIWVGTMPIETEDGTKSIPVPKALHDLIVLWMGTDTFVTPFTVSHEGFGVTLEVTSEPSGLTLIFVPMNPGDINADKVVDIFDVAKVGLVYGRYDMFADLNFDLNVDIFDLAHVAVNYGEGY